LHCRSGGGFAPEIQTTTNARLFTTAQNLFVCHHFGNAVVIGSARVIKKIFKFYFLWVVNQVKQPSFL